MRWHLNRMNHGTSVHLLSTLSRLRHRTLWRNWRSINLLRLHHRRQRSSGHNICLQSPLFILQVLLRHIFVILLLLSSHAHRRRVSSIRLMLWISVLRHSRRIVHILHLTESRWLSIIAWWATDCRREVRGIVIRWCSRRLVGFTTEEEDSEGC